MPEVARSGGCLCGGVRFHVAGEPIRVGLCHCKDCRKTSGSAFHAYAVWPLHAFQTSGMTSTYGARSFCPTCGSRVPFVGEDEVEVTIGNLDVAPTEGLVPSYELWIGRRESWLRPLPGARQFEHDRIAGDSMAGDETGREPRPRSARDNIPADLSLNDDDLQSSGASGASGK